jgi:hypothetical protein
MVRPVADDRAVLAMSRMTSNSGGAWKPVITAVHQKSTAIGLMPTKLMSMPTSDAPATAYVPIPERSSSDAPVMKPGPRI